MRPEHVPVRGGVQVHPGVAPSSKDIPDVFQIALKHENLKMGNDYHLERET